MTKQIADMERPELERKLSELRVMHRDLDDSIDALSAKSNFDYLQIKRLKKQKLQIKDQIAQIESALLPDIIA